MTHPVLEAIQAHLLKNFPEYLIFLSALSIAVICTIPEMIPKSAQEWWTWMRSALQTAVPAARHSQITVNTPQATVSATGTNVSASTPPVEVAASDPTSQQETK